MDNNAVALILHGEQLGVLENSITLLEEQVNVLENTDVTIQESLDALEAADVTIEGRLNDLEIAVNDTSGLDDLAKRVIKVENMTTLQQNEINELVITAGAHDNDIAAIQDINNEFEQRIAQLENGSSTTDLVIGFHARLTSSDLPDAWTPIPYDYVLVNVGNRYSPDTGIFTAHIAGLYYFQQYWVIDPSYVQALYIYNNNVVQCRSYGDSYGSGDFNSQSCSAVIELQPGDEVYVTSIQGEHTTPDSLVS